MEEKIDSQTEPVNASAGEISFKIGDVFRPDDELAVGLVSLASAMNDLVRVNGWLLGDGHSSDDAASERTYLFRLALAHFHETRETLKEVRKLDSAADLFGSLSLSGTEDLYTLVHLNSVGPDWFQKSITYLRNKTFHYGGAWGWDDESWALEEAAGLESGITWGGGTIGDLRLDFAEEVLTQHLTRHFPETGRAAGGGANSEEDLVEERLGEMMRALAEATGAAMRVIQELIAKYIAVNSGLALLPSLS